MNILVLGSGGREHALVWKVKQSKRVQEVFCIPGNPGTGRIAKTTGINIDDFSALITFVKKEKISHVIVGPEAPLVDGIVDVFRKEGLAIFGPETRAAQLEGSKSFAKSFMKKYRIPTAEYQVCRSAETAKTAVNTMGVPVVIKASGLAAGKGVIIARTREEAYDAIDRMMVKKEFGAAGREIVIEQFLNGEEASIIAFCDTKTLFSLHPSQDHKRVFDDDQGPNTGGMGAYAPAPVVTSAVMKQIEESIFKKFLIGIQEEQLDFRGVIYFGLMMTAQGPSVLEFNVRFGDPETQVILPLLDADITEIIEAVNDKKLAEWVVRHPRSLSSQSAVCVVLASGGYPGSFEKGKKICGLEEYDPLVFHAGTARKGNDYITSGGRVLGVTAVSNTLDQAIKQAYQNIKKYYFDGMHFRKDIGQKAIQGNKR